MFWMKYKRSSTSLQHLQNDEKRIVRVLRSDGRACNQVDRGRSLSTTIAANLCSLLSVQERKLLETLKITSISWMKKRVRRSDITINIEKEAPIPECPVPGERWKEVRNDNTVMLRAGNEKDDEEADMVGC
ncbi:hypothetical protein Leryth_020494 [Lithospermum erythrorhizon]|nr:hypothetical protein Leryth_020494 [Lithospermum erythrorhizon]